MNWWTMVSYGVAAVLALQGLFTLMMAHRQQMRRRFFDEEVRRRKEEAVQAPEPETLPASQKSKAA